MQIWDAFMDSIEPFACRIPYMVGTGNHEYDYQRECSPVLLCYRILYLHVLFFVCILYDVNIQGPCAAGHAARPPTHGVRMLQLGVAA